jgi:hypothetical protein
MFFKIKAGLFSVCVLVVLQGILFAERVQIYSLKELADEWQKANERMLVVLDVDEVLITTEDHVFHSYADEARDKIIGQAIAKADNKIEKKQEIEHAMGIVILNATRVLVEEETPVLIQNLQKKKVPVIALTSCSTGRLGPIEKMELWRAEHLKSLQIDFSSSFPAISSQSFEELSIGTKRPPIYERGILFSHGYKKGDVLAAFLKKNRIKPSKVIFIDDLVENLASVESSLETLGIPSKTVHYLGAKRFYKELNEEIILYQFKHLMKEKQWLSDAEVALRLDQDSIK